MFQFQYGSIGRFCAKHLRFATTRVSIPVWFDWESFYYIFNYVAFNVSIPVWFDWENVLTTTMLPFSTGFNSSMVRLGADGSLSHTGMSAVFQFQYGSIGRLPPHTARTSPERVSIPVWFDWEPARCSNMAQCVRSFNSSMVRLGGTIPQVIIP